MRAKNTMGMNDGGTHVVDELKRLGQHEAIKLVRRDPICRGQITDDRRAPVCSVDVEHITPVDVRAESISVDAIFDFERTAADVPPVLLEEAFDVIAINRRAAVIAMTFAQGRGSADRPEPCRTHETAEAFPLVGANPFQNFLQEGRSHQN